MPTTYFVKNVKQNLHFVCYNFHSQKWFKKMILQTIVSMQIHFQVRFKLKLNYKFHLTQKWFSLIIQIANYHLFERNSGKLNS